MKINAALQNLQGVVYKKTTGHFSVHCAETDFVCTLSPRLLQQKGKPVSKTDIAGNLTIAVGDWVRVKDLENGTGMILEVMDRKNDLSRCSAGSQPGSFSEEQIIAANLDQVVPVFAAAQPTPHWKLLDRYLVTAEAQGIPALICITKVDLIRGRADGCKADIQTVMGLYAQMGYPVIWVSAFTGEGLDELKQALQGRFSVLLGKSGVGKTSLLNALQPGLGLSVKEVNPVTGKGRHTTTHQEMFTLTFGGSILDSPGNREFGLWGIERDELPWLFPEMQPYLGKCKFGLDCSHDEEPGCAIRKAVTAGQISPHRYQSYLYLLEDL